MMTAKEGAQQRRSLLRGIDRGLREKASKTLRELREQLHAAYAARNRALTDAKGQSRAARLVLRETALARRRSALAGLRDLYAKERAEARDAYLLRKAEVHAAALDPIATARGKWEAERKYQADLRRIEHGNRARHREVHRSLRIPPIVTAQIAAS